MTSVNEFSLILKIQRNFSKHKQNKWIGQWFDNFHKNLIGFKMFSQWWENN